MATTFPTRRFRGAGATAEEVAAMTEEFVRSDISVQEAIVDHFRSQSRTGLKEYLENWRARRWPKDDAEEDTSPESTQRPLGGPESEETLASDDDAPEAVEGETTPDTAQDEPSDPTE